MIKGHNVPLSNTKVSHMFFVDEKRFQENGGRNDQVRHHSVFSDWIQRQGEWSIASQEKSDCTTVWSTYLITQGKQTVFIVAANQGWFNSFFIEDKQPVADSLISFIWQYYISRTN